MANQQVIVSVLGDTKNFSRSMKNSSAIMKGFQLAVVAAVVGMGKAFTDFIGDSVSAAEDAAAVQRRFENMAKQSALFGDTTAAVTKRIEDYARAQSFATGVDDEAILAAATKVMAFQNVAKSAGILNGVYDRTIAISLDLASVLGGTGDGLSNIESIAPKVAKALENPIKYMGLLARVGVKMTDVEKEKITKLQETNGIYAAQDYLLQQLEGRYGGAAEAGAKASEKIQARFEDLKEQVGAKLLPAIETMADEFGKWLDGPAGKKAIAEFVDSFKVLAAYLSNPENIKRIEQIAVGFGKMAGAIADIFGIAEKFMGLPEWLAKAIFGGNYDAAKKANDAFNNYESGTGTSSGSNVGSGSTGYGSTRMKSVTTTPSIVVNFNTPVDSVSAGREVSRVLTEFARANGRR
jgi:hypothetical protein